MRTLLALALLFAAFVASSSFADEKPAKTIGWKMHAINAQSEFPACAAFDVDHDGDIDIYSGGWWYEAPVWKKHKVRDVEVIRGRFDDYSNQPQDCNGDGWTDIISVNYRSETIYWIEHPGKNLGKQDWTAHVIDKPGPSETGRLHDIDGDGDLDILPNGTTYAAWYEFKPEKKDGGLLEPKWVKHDLPKEAAGHGIGWNAKDKSILTPRGFAVQSENGSDAWKFTPFGMDSRQTFHSDAGIPILSKRRKYGEQLVWGRGHRTGIYSGDIEEVEGLHFLNTCAIDTSWSQCHCILWSDVDGDERADIVAGKRYMGHEGKDPGEYDPLAIYWYKYDDKQYTWTRNKVHERGPAGFDLDGVAQDVDADGDVDIVAPSRNGLYFFESLRINKHGVIADEPNLPPLTAYKDHSKLLLYATRDGDLRPVKTPIEWASRRADAIRCMEEAMGSLPATRSSHAGVESYMHIDPEIREFEAKEKDFTIYVGSLKADSTEKSKLTVMKLTPAGIKPGERRPAMLCLQPTGLDLRTLAGVNPKPNRGYAGELAKRGYICICPAYPTMYGHGFDLKSTDAHFVSGTMSAIWDNIRCIDELESLSNVDPDRIGVIGHSLGGHNGLFTACFDQRIKCVVTSCGFTPFHDYYGGKLEGWAQDRYMPRIREVYENNPDKMPFDFYEVLGAIAPRPIFINAPLHDDNFDVGGVKKCVAEVQKVYDLLGKKDGIVARYPDDKHDFPEKERMEAYEWLDKQLK